MNDIARPDWAGPEQRLDGRTVLVVGGVGGVGEGVVNALLTLGATVVATSRRQERAVEFADRFGAERLHAVVLDALSPTFTDDVAGLSRRFGPFDAVIIAIASWGEQGRKPLLALSDAEWDVLVAENQTAVFRAYRSLFPVIAADGMLLQLNGLSADLAFPGAGGVALTAAATKSMTRTVAAETAGRGPRVYELVLGVIRTRARRLNGIDDPRWIDGEEIGIHLSELLNRTSRLAAEPLQYFVDKRTGPSSAVPAV